MLHLLLLDVQETGEDGALTSVTTSTIGAAWPCGCYGSVLRDNDSVTVFVAV
jgi:hypothetical protein